MWKREGGFYFFGKSVCCAFELRACIKDVECRYFFLLFFLDSLSTKLAGSTTISNYVEKLKRNKIDEKHDTVQIGRV